MSLTDRLVITQAAEAGLPTPVREFRFDPARRWRFDYCWQFARGVYYDSREVKIALEVQGGIWTGGKHGRGSGIVKDHEKLNAAQCAGWAVLQLTPQQVRAGELTYWLLRATGQPIPLRHRSAA